MLGCEGVIMLQSLQRFLTIVVTEALSDVSGDRGTF